MRNQATKRILSFIIILIFISISGIAQNNTTLSKSNYQPNITQDDLIYIYNPQNEGLMSAKELFEFDRILKEQEYNSKKFDHRIIEVINLYSIDLIE
jgi:hypothetical protein